MIYYKLRDYFNKEENFLNEILKNRGVENVEEYLHPTEDCLLDPYELDNIIAGRNMLVKHLENNSKICIVEDSDADGLTSSVILWLYLKKIKPDINLTLSIHEEKQHGIEDKTDWIIEENFDLVIVPDAGSYEGEYHKKLVEENIDCLVIDHHSMLYDENGNPMVSTSPNTIVINNQLSSKYSNKTLCGAGMVYKFCQILDDYFEVNYANDFLDLVALGEISDVMFQGTSETRFLIVKGLKNIKNKAFQALIEAQSYSLKTKAEYPYLGLTPIDVAFYISPLINAVTRVGTLAEKELMFMSFIDPMRELPSTKRGAKQGDIEIACQQFARVAGNIRNRQNREKEKAIEILEQRVYKEGIDDNNIIIIEVNDEDNIRKTLTGLIAAYFVNKFHKPCLIGRKSEDSYLRGSMRSNGNFESLPDFKNYLEETGMFEYVAGHASAAGFSLPEKQVKNFINFSNENLNEKDFECCYLIDYEFEAKESCIKNIGMEIGSAEHCFGNGIDEVKIVVKDIPLNNIMLMGANKDSVKISYNEIDYIMFKNENFIFELNEAVTKGMKMNILGRFNINTFGGKTTVQCFIEDYSFSVLEKDRYSF